MLDLFANGRPAEDLHSRVVRIKLAGTEYALPTLPIAGNRRWKAELDGRLAGLLDGLVKSGDDIAAIFALLSTQVDDLLELLISYDTTGVLPPRERLEETVYEDELVAAVREVWRAANPLVVTTIGATPIVEPQGNVSSPPTSSRRPNTAGRRKRSKPA
jgi:hypothetical protein